MVDTTFILSPAALAFASLPTRRFDSTKLVGVLSGSGTSVTNPCDATGSVVVSSGDVIAALFAEESYLEVSSVTDNLGNTYTAQNAGGISRPGPLLSKVSGRLFYSVVSVAGTLNAVHFATSLTSSNDWSADVAVLRGLFTTVDTNPANYAPTPSYSGPGDVVSGAATWVGLRAYSKAACGSNCIRLRRSSDNNEVTFTTLANGDLDIVGIKVWAGADTIYVVTWYDQSGNGYNFSQSTQANQPTLDLTGIYPAISFPGAASSPTVYLTAAGTPNQNSPFSTSCFLCNTVLSGGPTLVGYYGIGTGGSGWVGEFNRNGDVNVVGIADGAIVTVRTAPDFSWHAVQSVYNTTNSVVSADGSRVTGDIGATTNVNFGKEALGASDAFAGYEGLMTEFGRWNSAITPTQEALLLANQNDYYRGSYTGPGDLLPATCWWGLRAYCRNCIGARAVRLRRSSDNAEKDFYLIADGKLDVASITSWAAGSDVFVTTLCDQSGSSVPASAAARDLIQPTSGNQYQLILAGLDGITQPVMKAELSKLMYSATNVPALNQPPGWTYSSVFSPDRFVGAFGSFYFIVNDVGGATPHLKESAGYIDMSSGLNLDVPATLNGWHATQAVFHCDSFPTNRSALYVNNASVSGDTGANNYTAFSLYTGYDTAGLVGAWTEIGVWATTPFSAAQAASITNNQLNFWGVSLAPYTGPGDLAISGAAAWWGLRAYSRTKIGRNVVRLRRDSDNAEADFATRSDGSLDTPSITRWAAGAGLFVTKLYEQVGTIDLAQATSTNQPTFTLNGVGSLPVITMYSNSVMASSSTTSAPQPFTVSTTCLGVPGGQSYYCISGVGRPYLGNSDNILTLRNDNTNPGLDASFPTNVWHAVQAVGNSASSEIYMDGVSTTGDSGGTASFNGTFFQVGYIFGGGPAVFGKMTEIGLWSGIFSSANKSDMNSSQIAYWLGSYVGPGDVAAGATAWWGLRAYRKSAIGQRAIRLRRDSDNAEQDFVTVIGGGLDTASIISFKGAANLYCVKTYDQVGTFDLSQSTSSAQPSFLLNQIGSLPALFFVRSSSQQLVLTSGFPSLPNPDSLSIVFKQTYNAGVDKRVFGSRGGNVAILNDNQGSNANTFTLYAGTVSATVTCSDSVWHAVQALFDGAASKTYVDGSLSTGLNAGTYGMLDDVYWGGPVFYFDGYSTELGIWPSDLSASFSALNSNQRTYWCLGL